MMSVLMWSRLAFRSSSQLTSSGLSTHEKALGLWWVLDSYCLVPLLLLRHVVLAGGVIDQKGFSSTPLLGPLVTFSF